MPITAVISLVSVCVAVGGFIFSIIWNGRNVHQSSVKEIEDRTAENVKINLKLDNIGTDVRGVGSDIKEMRTDLLKHNDRLIKIEGRVDSLEKRVDSMETRINLKEQL